MTSYDRHLGQVALSEFAGGGADQRLIPMTANVPSGESMVKRALGCLLLVDVMPETAVDEALESLWEIAEFHREGSQQLLPAPRAGVVRGTAGRGSERGGLVISE